MKQISLTSLRIMSNVKVFATHDGRSIGRTNTTDFLLLIRINKNHNEDDNDVDDDNDKNNNIDDDDDDNHRTMRKEEQ